MAKINATNMDQNELEAAQNALADEVAHRFLKHAKAELVTGSDPVVVAVGMQNALVNVLLAVYDFKDVARFIHASADQVSQVPTLQEFKKKKH